MCPDVCVYVYVWPLPKSFSSIRDSGLSAFAPDSKRHVGWNRQVKETAVRWASETLEPGHPFIRLFPECFLFLQTLLSGSGARTLRISPYRGRASVLSERHQQINSWRPGTLLVVSPGSAT